MSSVFGVFQEAGAFALLAERYPDAALARGFLFELGLPIGRLPAMTAGARPVNYWFRVCQAVDHGVSTTVGLAELAEAAAAAWPGDAELAALAVVARAAETGPTGAGG